MTKKISDDDLKKVSGGVGDLNDIQNTDDSGTRGGVQDLNELEIGKTKGQTDKG